MCRLRSLPTGIIIAGYVAFPVYFYLLQHGYTNGIIPFVFLFSIVGFFYSKIPSFLNSPPSERSATGEREAPRSATTKSKNNSNGFRT